MILVFAAHPDDVMVACGGTIAKYARQGKKVVPIIFSYGENTNPLLDPSYLTARLINESKKAFNILGSKPVLLGLSDINLKKKLENPEVEKKIKALLSKNKPEAVFVHDSTDPRPAHKIIYKFVMELIKKLKLKARIYTFSVDIPFKLIHREHPKLYVDISSTFKTKQRAVMAFKSHREINIYQQGISKIRDIVYGLRAGVRAAEVFYRLN